MTMPFLTAALPGIGGQMRTLPEDFQVEERPLYLPCGESLRQDQKTPALDSGSRPATVFGLGGESASDRCGGPERRPGRDHADGLALGRHA